MKQRELVQGLYTITLPWNKHIYEWSNHEITGEHSTFQDINTLKKLHCTVTFFNMTLRNTEPYFNSVNSGRIFIDQLNRPRRHLKTIDFVEYGTLMHEDTKECSQGPWSCPLFISSLLALRRTWRQLLKHSIRVGWILAGAQYCHLLLCTSKQQLLR